MAETLNISTILNHLAWLREQLGVEVNRGNAHAGALLTYNAAAMLQWRFVFPSGDEDRIEDADDRIRAAKLIDDFVWEVRGLHQEAKALDESGRPKRTATQAVLDKLTAQLTKLLRQLPKIAGLHEPRPEREVGLEQEIQTGELVGDWVRSQRGPRGATSKGGVAAGPRSGLLSTMAGVVFVQQPQQGPAAERIAAASADIVAAFLGLAVEEHVQGLPARSAERTAAFGRDLQAQLVARSS